MTFAGEPKLVTLQTYVRKEFSIFSEGVFVENKTGARPTIESDRTVATVTFPLKSAIQRLSVFDVPVNVPVNVPVKLTDTQQKILELIRNNPSITHIQMSQRLSINEKTAKRATQTLRGCLLLTDV